VKEILTAGAELVSSLWGVQERDCRFQELSRDPLRKMFGVIHEISS